MKKAFLAFLADPEEHIRVPEKKNFSPLQVTFLVFSSTCSKPS